MNLAVFTSQYPARVSTFFARDMRVLVDYGFEVHVFPVRPVQSRNWQYIPSILPSDKLPPSQVHAMTIREGLQEWLRLPGHARQTWLNTTPRVLTSAIKYGIRPFLKSLYTVIKALGWSRLFLEIGFDHILAYWGNYAATAAVLIHKMHGLQIPVSSFLHAGTDLYRDQVFLREKLMYLDNIIVVCEFNREFLQKLYPDLFPYISHKITLHHLGLDLNEFDFHLSERADDLVLGVGRLSPAKGFQYLLQAIALLKKRGMDVRLELIGDGPWRTKLERLTTQSGISDRVVFRGWLPEHQVRETMQKATLLVHPSPALGDAVPTVIKEAMASGAPVIASSIAGIPELLADGNCGILVPPQDPTTLADAIEQLILSPQLRLEYAYKARKQAERLFNMWVNGAQLASLLQSSRRHIQ